MNCLSCNKVIRGRSDRKFCNHVCRREFHHPKLDRIENCLNCGKKLNGRTDKKYCSIKCRNATNNKKIKEKYEKIKVSTSVV